VEWDSTLILELRYAALHGMIVALVVARISERNGGEDPGLADEAMCGCICGPCIPIEPREQRNRVSMWMRRVKRAIGQSCYLQLPVSIRCPSHGTASRITSEISYFCFTTLIVVHRSARMSLFFIAQSHVDPLSVDLSPLCSIAITIGLHSFASIFSTDLSNAGPCTGEKRLPRAILFDIVRCNT
jgi:hypothetical protein